MNPNNIKKTTKQYKYEVESKFSGLEVVGEYAGETTKIDIKFKECGCVVKRHAGALSQRGVGSTCPHHTEGYGVWETNKDFQDRLDKLPNGNLEIIGVYNGSTKTSKFRCRVCFHEFRKKGYDVIANKGKCPSCAKSNNSTMHLFLGLVLQDLGFEFIREYRIDKYRYDYFIQTLNLLIEYDGVQHFKPTFSTESFDDTVKADREKDRLANEKGINLLRFRYDEPIITKLLEYIESSTTIESIGLNIPKKRVE